MKTSEKTQSGEPYKALYITTFLVPVAQDGGFTFMHARVWCPESELNFYQVIGGLRKRESIDALTHLTAERQLFLEGFIRVD